MNAPTVERRRLVVTGVVQGVGFRPFVHRLANRLHLSGTVTNSSARVVIEVAGVSELLDRFQQLLVDEAPPLASIESLIADRLTDRMDDGSSPTGGFTIVASDNGGDAQSDDNRVFVAADTAHCEACRAEMHDPSNRRYRHPFISCTDCGPRFTIIESLPYDRPSTTMAGFEMCTTCHDEYHDPSDRRFHAQPISCHDCGPTLSFRLSSPGAGSSRNSRPGRHPVSPGLHRTGESALATAAELVLDGGVAVVKGVGGFQLTCDAGNDDAVRALRAWKHRPGKPLAVLVADLAMARRLVELDAAEEELLTSAARPIVLARRRSRDDDDPCGVADGVAPTQPRLGVMLPSSPLHDLLAAGIGRPLVLTSGNVSGAPMAHRDDQLADLLTGSEELDVPIGVLTHDRPIAVPCDDSVLRVGTLGPTFVRRGRGHAPTAVEVGGPGAPLLAVGGQLKNTFCLAGPAQGWVSQHVGDMDDLDTVRAFGASVERFERFYRLDPEAVLVDAHPDHGSRAWARRHRPDLPLIEVQHHHAHVASVLAEHGVGFDEPVIGVAFDGTGHGLDRRGQPAVWGGEFLAVTGSQYRRVGHLKPVPMPGGDAAVVNPYRVALVHLHHAGIDAGGLPPAAEVDERERSILARQLETGFGCLPNTSMGRLFDAVSSIVGLRHRISYEAQGAIDLELAATRAVVAARERGSDPAGYGFAIDTYDHRGSIVLEADPGPVLAAIVADVRAGRSPDSIALGFHRAVVDLIVEVCRTHVGGLETDVVALSGGVFQNALLTDETAGALHAAGFQVLTNRLVPPNDGGLALGQAYVGRHHLRPSTMNDTTGERSCA